MKKTLALFLALITILSVALVACKKNTTSGGGSADDGDDDFISIKNQNTGTTDTSDTNGGNTETWRTPTDSEKTVYVMATGVRIRKEASSKGEIITSSTSIGATYTTLSISEDWYKIQYTDTQEAYISTKYSTVNASEATFTALSTPETITVEEADQGEHHLYLRPNPSLTEDTGSVDMTRAKSSNGELKKVAVNGTNTIWKVEYTPAGGSTGTYYIGSGAFMYFDNLPNTDTGLG